MAPILYKIDASPPSNAVLMLADIIGLELELKDVDFGALEHKSPEFLKMNPLGTLPVLKDGDFTVTDSHVIMQYLLSKYGGSNSESLYPSDLRTRTMIDQALYFDTGVFFIRLKLIALPSLFSDLTEVPKEVKQEIVRSYDVLEAYLQNHKYIAADSLTIADLALGATTSALQPFYKLNELRHPRTVYWLSQLEKEPFFKKIMIPGSELLGKIVQAAWETNKNYH